MAMPGAGWASVIVGLVFFISSHSVSAASCFAVFMADPAYPGAGKTPRNFLGNRLLARASYWMTTHNANEQRPDNRTIQKGKR